MFPTPAPVAWSRCRRCKHKTRTDKLIGGFGQDCATLLGLIATTPRLRVTAQVGPDLFAAADEDDACDGWDR